MSEEEILPLVDEEGLETGRAPRSDCHAGPGKLHPVVHLHIFNAKGELYLQQRSAKKDTFAGRWDTAVGGHMGCGEQVRAALRREALEELGISGFSAEYLGAHIIETAVESEYVHVFVSRFAGPFSINTAEISQARFWTTAEIEAQLEDEIFTPNFVADYRRYLQSGELLKDD